MIFIKINDTMYPAIIEGSMHDAYWDNRQSKAITLEMDYAKAVELFIDGVEWSIVEHQRVPVFEVDENGEYIVDENGEYVQSKMTIEKTEFDNSEYSLAGDITDHRDGTITVKMGKLTDLEEAYEIMLGGI